MHGVLLGFVLIQKALSFPADAEVSLATIDPSIPIPQPLLDYVTPVLKFAALAYCDTSQITSQECTLCNDPAIKSLTEIVAENTSTTDLQWWTGVVNNTIVISIRGSANAINWIQNFDTFKMQQLTQCKG
jgi:hypothetical protein